MFIRTQRRLLHGISNRCATERYFEESSDTPSDYSMHTVDWRMTPPWSHGWLKNDTPSDHTVDWRMTPPVITRLIEEWHPHWSHGWLKNDNPSDHTVDWRLTIPVTTRLNEEWQSQWSHGWLKNGNPSDHTVDWRMTIPVRKWLTAALWVDLERLR